MINLPEICNDEFAKGNCIALLPCLGVLCEGYFSQNNITFAENNSVVGLDVVLNTIKFEEVGDAEEDILNKINGCSLRDAASMLTGVSKKDFLESDLAIMTFDPTTIDLNESHEDDLGLLKELSDRAFNALNIIRFIHCDLVVTDKLPNIPGYWAGSNGYYGAVILHPTAEDKIIAGRQMGGMVNFGLGIGLEHTDVFGMEGHPFILSLNNEYNVVGEVGQMIEHALKIYNRAMYSNNETQRFITIMALFEYLGTGDKYTNFKRVRPKLQAHLAKTREKYSLLSEEFQLFTSKVVDGSNIGYRTRIIHEGSLLEDLLPSANERKRLFQKPSSYVVNIIRGMYSHTSKSLPELQEHRKQLLNNIGIST